MKRVVLLLSLVVLGSCSTGVWNLPSYENLDSDKSGIVFMSIGDGGQGLLPNARFSVDFRPVKEPNMVGSFFFRSDRTWGTSVDIQDNKMRATLAARRLPPGTYEIYAAGVLEVVGSMSTRYGDRRPFSFKFEVLPGKAIYLGEFLGYPVIGKGVFGQSVAAGALYTVSDKKDRDLALLRKRGQGYEFPDTAVINSVMTKEQASNSIFRRLD
jgi:hypothetical protein